MLNLPFRPNFHDCIREWSTAQEQVLMAVAAVAAVDVAAVDVAAVDVAAVDVAAVACCRT